ncbi:MAG: dTDP-4-dehydrorhamnose 3,5-epimerase family protein [Nitrospiraceae bacterium]|nr:MAG: dTDP-4-dehydrorhamnose 3,5-epimerase family protein [Nitrospiraceae bacterium]
MKALEGIIIKELDVFEDQRGWLVEIFREDDMAFRPVMSYVSMTQPGIVRGPHEHHEQTDFFCFLGNFKVYLWDNRKESKTYMEKMVLDMTGKPFVAIVPPRIVHAYKNIGQEDALVINLPDRLYRGKKKEFPVDEVRYEDNPDSPFRID